MGKHNKQKLRSKPISSNEKPVIDETVRQERVLPIITALKSSDAGERSSSLIASLNVLENRNIRHMLLRERLIKVILTNTLSDSSLETVAQGFGVLRNVVLSEGRDPAVFLLRENVRIPVESISKKIITSLTELSSLETNDRKVLSAMIENVCGLVAAIVMYTSDTKGWRSVLSLACAVATSNEQHHLSPESIDTAFELLYYISEDLEQDETIEVLQREEVNLKTAALESDSWSRRIYGLGIEFNSLLTQESEILDICKQICQFLKDVPKEDINSVQVALDLLALAAQTADLEQVLLSVKELGSLLLELEQSGKDYQRHAISILNNIGWSLNALKQEWTSDAEKVFNTVISNSFQDFENTELISSASGSLGATLVQNPDLALTSGFKDLASGLLSRVENLLNVNDAEWIDVSRASIVVLANDNSAAKLNLVEAATHLILMMLESRDAPAQIDALNALFDIHGDNDSSYNEKVYNGGQINKRLQEMKPLSKRSLKSTPKTDEVLREQALDALTTLDNFIAYKSK